MEILPFALTNFNASYTAKQALFIKERLHPLVDIAIHPAGHYIRANILDMPDQKDPTKWTFQILSTWLLKLVEDYDNEGDRLKRLKEHIRKAGWAEPYKSAIEWIPEDTEVSKDQLKIWKTVSWNNQNGRVTLCGDAAHAMTFRKYFLQNNYQLVLITRHRLRSRRQQCLLFRTLSRRGPVICTSRLGTLRDAITAYDEDIWKRGAHGVQISKAQTFFTLDGLDNFINSPVVKLGTKPSHSAKAEGHR
jgi:hypothetical protein